MTPIAKELEPLTAASSPAVTQTIPPRNSQETSARPQPVPLEVAVTVNGARTVEGTDKREPFSESTKTVLVFGNGAVIRLASTVAPGQLLFVTNEKSKKEVVCQVVKSRNDGKSTGYVELEFTEPAVGFWGVRIPGESSLPSAPAALPKAPAAPRAVVPPTAAVPAVPPAGSALPSIVPSTVAPRIAPPAPSPVVVAPKIAVVPPPAPVAQTPAIPAELASKPEIAAPIVAGPTVVPVSTPKPAAAETSFFSIPPDPLRSIPKESEAKELPAPLDAPANELSSEELKQQAARLQEQLNALLFRGAAAEKAALPGSGVVFPAAEKDSDATSEAAHQIFDFAELSSAPKPPAMVEVAKIAPVPPAPAEWKQSPIVSKSAPISLPVEEVKIPSWLAPLTRETDNTSAEAPSALGSTSTFQSGLSDVDSETGAFGSSEEASQRSEAVMFGGQLLSGTATADAPSSGSKKGLFLGLAAAAALLVAGGVWYEKQPGNFLAGMSSPTPSVESSAPQLNESAATADAGTTRGANAAQPPSTKPSTLLLPGSNDSTSSASAATPVRPENSSARNIPLVEEPKKPLLGNVRLATPSVNHTADASAGETAPSIENAQGTATGEALNGITSSHGSGPAVPLPVGGDVRPARLLKSAPPIYPPTAKTQRVSGDVTIDALIDASGAVTSTKVVSGPTLLHQAAIAAVKQWKYEAAQLDGKATAMHLTVTVQFRLQ